MNIMLKFVEIRDVLIKIYQKIRFIINPVVRFFVAWLVIANINADIGYDKRFTSSTIAILLSAVCAFLPPSVTVFLAMLIALLHIYSVSLYLAAFVLIAFIVLYCLMLRFTPKQAIVVVLIPLLCKYNLHYVIPLVLGSIYTPLMIIPCCCGIAVKYIIDIASSAAAREVTASLDDIIQFYTDIADAFMGNKAMYVMMIVFALVIVVIFVIRKLSFEYSLPISIGAGVVTNILAFLIAELKVGTVVSIGSLLRMSIVAGIIAYVVEFMKRVLDYTAIEHLQFEDDDYYYYVKAVPKLKGNFDLRSGRITEEEYEEYEEEYGDRFEDEDNYEDEPEDRNYEDEPEAGNYEDEPEAGNSQEAEAELGVKEPSEKKSAGQPALISFAERLMSKRTAPKRPRVPDSGTEEDLEELEQLEAEFAEYRDDSPEEYRDYAPEKAGDYASEDNGENE